MLKLIIVFWVLFDWPLCALLYLYLYEYMPVYFMLYHIFSVYFHTFFRPIRLAAFCRIVRILSLCCFFHIPNSNILLLVLWMLDKNRQWRTFILTVLEWLCACYVSNRRRWFLAMCIYDCVLEVGGNDDIVYRSTWLLSPFIYFYWGKKCEHTAKIYIYIFIYINVWQRAYA